MARTLVDTGARPTEETTDRGPGPVRTLRLAGPTRHQVARLNELIAEHVRLDRTVHEDKATVLVDQDVLQYVHPHLRGHVAAPHPSVEPSNYGESQRATGLVLPPEPVTGQIGSEAGYTLYLDRAGLATPNPTTDEVGHAQSWEQLQWMALGARPFERGGRLWALDRSTNEDLSMADIAAPAPPTPIS